MELLLWAVPLLAVALLALPLPRRALHAISVAESALLLLAAVWTTRTVLLRGTAEPAMPGNLLYVDAVSAVLLNLVAAVGLAVCVYAVGYVEGEIRHGSLDPAKVRRLYLLMHAFLATMVLTLTVRNLGAMWIAIEATTLASVFLVGFHGGKPALEAAWKYIILCSVGISLALVGVVFLNAASKGALPEGAALDWPALYAAAGSGALDPALLRFAFVFLLLGFGTKAGLAPLHNWLPDAHSQAPSPVSALLSGVLLNAAMYAVLRSTAIVNRALGGALYTGRALVALGVLSVATAALFLLTQKDYKRLLAYSSIEHMGLVALSAGLATPLSLFAAFYHMVNHSFTKSMLFLSSGTILQKHGTREISKVRNLLRTLPVTGPAFLLGLLAIGGAPPFAPFASELNVLAAAFSAGHPILGAVVAVLLALVFAGIVQALFRVFFPKPEAPAAADAAPAAPSADDAAPEPARGEPNRAGAAAVVVLLAAVLVLGLYLPPFLRDLLVRASALIQGVPAP